MGIEKDIFRIVNKNNTSIRRDIKTNGTIVNDSSSFKGLTVSATEEIIDITANYLKIHQESKGVKHQSLDSLYKSSEARIKQSTQAILRGKGAAEIKDSYFNSTTNVNTESDFSSYGETFPNLWLSPYEGNSLYSQKGIAELIINKKSKSIHLNGVKIKNPKLTAKEIDEISLNMFRLGLTKILSDATRDSLVAGGALCFPIFNKDNPATAHLSPELLLKIGVLKKNSIARFVTLDRWNVVHVPTTNPTAADWLNPMKYYIPFLGSDVHGRRCARIVTGSQAGYLGKLMTMGWGLSDFVGFMKSLTDYKNAVQTIPLMVQQMSILARTIPVEGILATEGANALDAVTEQNTIKMSKWSPNNPITLDALGTIQVIDRNFTQVPELIRLLRQDAASDANVPEPMLWSSEKGNFSSGDDTQGNLAKQYESIKYVHKDIENDFLPIAKMLVIDALGTDKRILDALPYTQIHFDSPLIANSTERAEIGLNLAKSFFEFTAGQMPLHESAILASNYGGDDLSISSELLDALKARQAESDERAKLKFEKEIELMDAQIESAKNSAQNQGEGKPSSASKGKESAAETKNTHKVGSEEGKGYDRLEQKKHEKTRIGSEKRQQSLTKMQNKAHKDD